MALIKFIVCVLLFSSLHAQSPNELKYTISLINDETPHFEVSLEFKGDTSGTTEILLPSSWAGQNELYQEITELRTFSSQSRIEETSEPFVKKIHHLPNDKLKISYQYHSQQKKDHEWFYRPIIQPTYFYFIGHSFFIIPRINPDQQISLEWENIPKDWTLANSYNVGTKKQKLSVSLNIFAHAVYTGGDFRLLQCGEEKSPIYIAIREKWAFSDEKFADLVKTIIESQRQFWNDFDFPHYLITVLPNGTTNYLGGTGLINAFSLFLRDALSENPNEWKQLVWLLSHEHFHTWNGNKMMSGPPVGKLFWFSEGFTEYYAVALNLRNGLMSFNDYIEHLNTILYNYHASPVRNEKNERFEQDLWKNPHIQKLPYDRGFLFALSWDKKIRKATDDRYCLDDFMKALFKKNQEDNKQLDKDTLEQVACGFLPPEIVKEDLEAYIINGQTLTPDPNYFDLCTLVWIENPGFDLRRTEEKGGIEGVKEGSNAFQAGLRDGQRFLSYQMSDNMVSVRIMDKDQIEKELKYVQEITSPIPQYQQESANNLPINPAS